MKIRNAVPILFILLVFFLITNFASAQQVLDPVSTGQLKLNTDMVGKSAGLGSASVGSIVAVIINACLGLLGAIFLVLMIFAGFQWMTASGNEAQVKKAQDIIKNSLIGLIIVLAAYAITYFIFTYLPFTGGTAGTPPTGGASGNNPPS